MIRLVQHLLVPASILLAGCSVDWDRVDSGVIRLHPVESGQPIGHGSAFAINSEGYYVTNYHVVESAVTSSGAIQLRAVESIDPPKLHNATIIAASQEKDLAIVEIPGLKRPPLTLTTSAIKGQVVKSIGFPGGIELNNMFINPQRTSGTISGSEAFQLGPKTKKIEQYIHTATILGGNSGGPLVDACGRVVGVNVAKTASNLDIGDVLQSIVGLMQDQGSGQVPLNTQEGFFFSIKTSELISLLDQKSIPFNQVVGECHPGAGPPVWLLMLLAVMAAALAILGAGYRQLRKAAPQGRVDSKYISRLIKRKLGKNEMQSGDKNGQTQFVRDVDGRIQRVGGSGGKKAQDNHKQTLQPMYKLIAEQPQWPPITLKQGDRIVIGRDPNPCNMCLESDRISRQHAELFIDNQGNLKVHDLSSSNGTYVDHKKAPESAKGSDEGIVISVGNRLILGSESIVYRIEDG